MELQSQNGYEEVEENENSTVLYESENGESGNITLSDNISNYKYIKIYYRERVNHRASKEVLIDSSSLDVPLEVVFQDNDYFYISSVIYTLSGSTMTKKISGRIAINSSNVVRQNESTSVYTKIYKVVGYKYIKSDNYVYEELKNGVTSGTLEYNSNIASVDINNWTRTGNVVTVAFRGLVENNISNNSDLLVLPFKPLNPGTPLLYVGDRYKPGSILFAYWSTTNIFKCAPIEAGEYVHIYFTYITNE